MRRVAGRRVQVIEAPAPTVLPVARSPLLQMKRVSLPESIADSIAEAIASRHLAPGERVVETALTQQLGVSRVPIREALKVLHAQGILSGGGHKGFRVAAFGPETIGRVFELRLMLETFLLRDAIANWREQREDPGELDHAITEMTRSARAADSRASLRADLEFHRTIARAARNDITAAMWEAIARHVLITFSLEHYGSDDLLLIVRQHEQLRDFINGQIQQPGPVEVLHKAMEDHLLVLVRAKHLGGEGQATALRSRQASASSRRAPAR